MNQLNVVVAVAVVEGKDADVVKVGSVAVAMAVSTVVKDVVAAKDEVVVKVDFVDVVRAEDEEVAAAMLPMSPTPMHSQVWDHRMSSVLTA